MIWVHFDRKLTTGFVFSENHTRIYRLDATPEEVPASKLSLADFPLFSNYIEKRLVQTEREIFSQLREYKSSNVAFLLFQFFKCNYEGIDVNKNLIEPLLINYSKIPNLQTYFVEHLSRNLLGNKALKNIEATFFSLTNGQDFINSVFEKYPVNQISKIHKSWLKVLDIVEIDESVLYYRASNIGYFDTLFAASLREVEPQDAYFKFATLVGNFPRKRGSIEDKFFESFEMLSRDCANLKKTYSQKSNTSVAAQKVSNTRFLHFFRAGMYIREELERKISYFADQVNDLDPKKILPASSDDSAKVWLEQSMSFWNDTFFKLCIDISDSLIVYFGSRHETLPRITIKGIEEVGTKLYINTIYRDHDVDYLQNSVADDNTGFSFSLKTGQPFFNNDLPACYRARIYSNARLPKLDEHNKKAIKRRISSKNGWMKIWEHGTSEQKQNAYKSTLIFPIRISPGKRGNNIEFDKNDYLVSGFLCVDHPEAYYFDPKYDIEVLRSSANVLGTYLSARRVTFLCAKLILKLITRLGRKREKLTIESLYDQYDHREIASDGLKRSIEREAIASPSIALLDIALIPENKKSRKIDR